MLRSPGGFGAGNSVGRGNGGSSLARMALRLLIFGLSGKRSRSIVSRSSSTRIVLSASSSFRHDLSMRRKRNDGDTAPVTLGQARTAQVRLIVWCKACGHRAEPGVAEQVSHHG